MEKTEKNFEIFKNALFYYINAPYGYNREVIFISAMLRALDQLKVSIHDEAVQMEKKIEELTLEKERLEAKVNELSRA